MSKRFPALGKWGPEAERKRTSEDYWSQPLRWDAAAKRAGERRRVFCASLADVFDDHQSIPKQWRDDLWWIIEHTPSLDWLLLTKRPENILALWPWGRKPPANVWIGTTVENQEYAEKRLPILDAIGATVRFVSYEPALGPVRWDVWMEEAESVFGRTIDWLIIGGESGHGARPFNLEWARAGIEAGRKYGVPVFVKQLGAKPQRLISIGAALELERFAGRNPDQAEPMRLKAKKGGDMEEWPEWARVRQIPGGSK